MAAWDNLPTAGGLGECSALVRSAEALRFSAPELAVQLARRALVIGAAESAAGGADHADQAKALSMRAHAVLAAGLVRISRYLDAVEPAFIALALAEGDGITELATSVRLDLAACSREVGEPLLGCALLRPVLENGQSQPSVRAIALGRLVGCTAHIGRRDDVEDALAEAERLIASDDGLGSDARRLERARLSVRAAAYHRWYGDTEDALDAAREGIAQLSRLRGRRPETDRLRAQLVLELVCGLLDEGEFGEAEAESVALLAEPVRATSAAAIGQLMLAVSTRIHIPSGRVDRGRVLLDQVVWVAERHGMDGLLADALTVTSQLDERAGRMSEALESLHAARSAEQRRMRATAKAARQILAEAGAATDWDADTATALLRDVARSSTPALAAVSSLPSHRPSTHTTDTETDEATGLLNREGLLRRLRAARNGERPVALTLVRLGETGTRSGINLTELAGRVRDMAPQDAELARSDGAELAVVLPRTTRDQAEQFAESLRQTAIESGWLSQANAQSISTGVGQSNPNATSVDARALLTAARHALTPAEPARQPGERTQPVPATALTAEALAELQDVGDTLRIGRSIISSLSIPTGSGGKRRAQTGTYPPVQKNPDHPSSYASSPETPAQPPTPAGEPTAHDTASALRAASEPPGSPTYPTADTTGSHAPSEHRAGEAVAGSYPAEGHDPSAAGGGTRAAASGTPGAVGGETPAATSGTPSAMSGTPAPTSGTPGATSGVPGTGSGVSGAASGIPGAVSGIQDAASGTSGAASGIQEAASGTPEAMSGMPGIASGSSDSVSGISAASGETSGAETSRAVGETGGYRPLVSFGQEAQPAGSGESATPGAYRSSYEETRAELARLMSALESKALPDDLASDVTPATESGQGVTASGARWSFGADSATGGSSASSEAVRRGEGGLARWSFRSASESAPLPAPSRPGDDYTNNGMAQSVPVPPEPSEVPEPPRRPGVPDPTEPDPIPAPPSEPGHIPPAEPSPPPGNPGSPPGGPWPSPTEPGRSPDEPGPLPGEPGRLPREPGHSPDESGLSPREPERSLDESGRSPEESGRLPGEYGRSAEEPGRLPAEYGRSAEEPGRLPAEYGGSPREPGRLSDEFGRSPREPERSPGEYGRSAGVSGDSAVGPVRSLGEAGPSGSARLLDESSGVAGASTGESAYLAGSQSNDEGESVRLSGEAGVGGEAAPSGAPSRRRGERSADTIAGLLAEALAAYQETSQDSDQDTGQDSDQDTGRDSDRDTGRDGDRDTGRDGEQGGVESAPPARESAVAEFDRLFDWRYQSPASGRHRSPE